MRWFLSMDSVPSHCNPFNYIYLLQRRAKIQETGFQKSVPGRCTSETGGLLNPLLINNGLGFAGGCCWSYIPDDFENENDLIELSKVIVCWDNNRFRRAQGQLTNCEYWSTDWVNCRVDLNAAGSLYNQLQVCCSLWIIRSSLCLYKVQSNRSHNRSRWWCLIIYSQGVYTGCTYTSQLSISNQR